MRRSICIIKVEEALNQATGSGRTLGIEGRPLPGARNRDIMTAERDPETREDALGLIRSIEEGSVEAWQAFVERYAGLILAVLRKHVFDADEVRNLFAGVLENLYKGGLSNYRGRAALSTWLVLVARNKAIDFLRKQGGRRGTPAGLDRLSRRDRHIFELYHRRGLDFEEVCRAAGDGEAPLSTDALLAALGRIEQAVDARSMRSAANDLYAESTGAASGRLLEYLELTRAESADKRSREAPDLQLLREEAGRVHRVVRDFIERLPPLERRVLELTYDDERSAKEIAGRLNLDGARKVYTLKEKALRKLRALLQKESWGDHL